jgi:hypothetical protein
VSDLPPPDTPNQPLPSPGSPGRRSGRTPLLVALGTVAVAALVIGGVAMGSGGGDDDSAPAPGASEETQETTSDTSVVPSPTSEPTASPDTAPAPTVEATTTVPRQVQVPSADAATKVGVLAEQQRPGCPVDAATVAGLADTLGGPRARRGSPRTG